MKRILIGCEESGTITNAFREAGFESYSCDTEPTRGNPDWHFQMDVMECIKTKGPWKLIILHPPCTALSVSGNPTYAEGNPGYKDRLAAIEWTCRLWEAAISACDYVALENPVSVIFQWLTHDIWRPQVCYVQPYEHGHGETKNTGFALHNLPPIYPTNNVPGRYQRIWKMGPSPTRKRDR